MMKEILRKLKAKNYLPSNISRRIFLYGFLAVCLFLFIMYYFFYQTPADFKANSTIRIERGQSLISISRSLKVAGIISSPALLTDLVVFMGGEHKVVAGYYLFQKPNDLFKIARRITHGDYEIVPIKVTIPEGLSSKEISSIYASKFNLFDSSSFYQSAKEKEGYLFPETYFFVPTVLPEDVLSMMQTTFNQKVVPIQSEIDSSGRSLNDIVTMASILEGEAIKTADRKIIAGILWKRIAEHIPLQVDSSLKYFTGKTSAELTLSDLKIDSPYNTYNRTGLPPTPISNPGLDSITAALNPTETEYFYFLSDKEGNIHYARTLKEHDANRVKYL